MPLNRNQKKRMKTYIIIASVLAGIYYVVFKTTWGKSFINTAALKFGIGTAAKPLIA